MAAVFCHRRQKLYRQNAVSTVKFPAAHGYSEPRVARQTQTIASGCSGSRAQSAQRGNLVQVEAADLLRVDRHVDVGGEDREQQRQQPPAAEPARAGWRTASRAGDLGDAADRDRLLASAPRSRAARSLRSCAGARSACVPVKVKKAASGRLRRELSSARQRPSGHGSAGGARYVRVPCRSSSSTPPTRRRRTSRRRSPGSPRGCARGTASRPCSAPPAPARPSRWRRRSPRCSGPRW